MAIFKKLMSTKFIGVGLTTLLAIVCAVLLVLLPTAANARLGAAVSSTASTASKPEPVKTTSSLKLTKQTAPAVIPQPQRAAISVGQSRQDIVAKIGQRDAARDAKIAEKSATIIPFPAKDANAVTPRPSATVQNTTATTPSVTDLNAYRQSQLAAQQSNAQLQHQRDIANLRERERQAELDHEEEILRLKRQQAQYANQSNYPRYNGGYSAVPAVVPVVVPHTQTPANSFNTQSQTFQQPVASNQQPDSGSSGFLTFLTIVLIAAIGGGVGWYFYNKKKSVKQNTSFEAPVMPKDEPAVEQANPRNVILENKAIGFYKRLQALNNDGNIEDITQMCSPEVASFLIENAKLATTVSVLENISAIIEEESDTHVVVCFTALCTEKDKQSNEVVTQGQIKDLWNLQRSASGFTLVGIDALT